VKIALVYDVIYPYVVGGVQLRNWELAKRLSRRGHDVTLFGMQHWPGERTIVKDGVRLCGVCPPKPLYAHGRRAIWPPIQVALRVLPWLLKERYDIVDVANFPYFPCFSAWLAASLRRSPLVVTWIEVWGDAWLSYLGRLGRLAMTIERACVGLGQAATAISEMTRRDLIGQGYRREIAVIGCGVDYERIAALAPAAEATDVLFIGRLIKEKNVDLLVRAIGLLAGARPGLRCTIVGDGPERDSLATLIDELGLGDHVRLTPFLPRHDDVFAAMKSSRVLVNPSSREGFGIIALEANACGLPVITIRSPRNACADLIREGENGFVCDPSAHGIAAALATALTDAPISREACERFARQHDWDRVADTLERFYCARMRPARR
jgi:glycosyltransferase involved in cell wall biosynthesis